MRLRLLLASLLLLSIVWGVITLQIWAFVLHFTLLLWWLWGTLHPNSRWFGPITTHTDSSSLWLTIDDGPSPNETPALLDLLDYFQVKATFFVVGAKATQFPELIELIIHRGHEIGNHSFSHPETQFWALGPIRVHQEIKRCQAALHGMTGYYPTRFRAPVGHFNPFVHPVLKETNLSLIGWSSRGYDTARGSLERIVSRLKSSMQPGAIVLIHEDTQHGIAVARAVLEHAQAKEWQWLDPTETSGNLLDSRSAGKTHDFKTGK